MLRKLALAVAATGSLLATPAFGLGIGEIKLDSALNQPMNAKISLLQADDLSENEIVVTLASTQEFARAGIARPFYLQDFQFDVIVDGEDFFVNIKSGKPIREPFVSFLMEINWPSGRSVKEFTVFLDPPVFDKANKSPASLNQAVVRSSQNAPSTLTTNTTVSLGAPSVNQPASQPTPRAIPKFIPKDENLADDEYRVQMDDTLWKVAQRVKHSGISTNSMMHALHKNNPKAFIRGDINRVKAGSILTIPSSDEVNSGQFSGAVVEAEVKPQILSNAVVEQTQTPVSDTDDVDGHLTLTLDSQGDESGDGAKSSDNAAEDELLKTEDLNDQLIRENEALSAKIEALELQLKYVDRLVGVQDETATTLQQLVQQEEKDKLDAEAEALKDSSGESAQDVMDATAENVSSELDNVNESAEMAPTDNESNMDEMSSDISAPLVDNSELVEPVSDVENVDSQAGSVNKVEEAVAPVVDVELEIMEPEVAGDMLSQALAFVENQIEKMKENTVYAAIVVASGVFILLLPFLLLALFRRKDEEEEVLILDDMPEAQVDDETLDQLEEESETIEKVEAQTDSESVEEALSNAELYIAYGHYEQAATAIQEIIASNPENVDLKLKLAEVYAEAGETQKLDNMSAELKALNDTVVNRKLAAVLEKAQMNTDNELEDEIDLTEEFGEQSITPTIAKEAPPKEEEFDLDFATDIELTDTALPDDSSSLDVELESESESNELEFDLNFDAPEIEESEEVALDKSENSMEFSLDEVSALESVETAAENVEEKSEENTLDFDLDLSSEFSPEAATEEDIDHSGNTLDLDLDLSADENESVQEEEFDFESDGGVSLEFDLDMGDAEEATEAAVETESLELDLDETPTLDSEEFDFDLGDTNEASEDSAEVELDFGEIDNLGDEEFDFDLGEVESTTDEDELTSEAQAFDENDQIDELASLSTALDNLADETRGAEDTLDADLASLTDDAEGLDFLSGGDEIGTKLDLARAYIDMDDTEGAREILEEITAEGDEEQKTQAKALLDQL